MTQAASRSKRFCELLREERERRGLKLLTAAKWAGVSEETWREFEAGREVPVAAQIQRVVGSGHRLMAEIPIDPECPLVRPPPDPPRGADAPPPPPTSLPLGSPPFAEALRSEMDRLGITLKKLAQIVGVAQSGVQNWVSGVCMPYSTNMGKIVELMPSLAAYRSAVRRSYRTGRVPRATSEVAAPEAAPPPLEPLAPLAPRPEAESQRARRARVASEPRAVEEVIAAILSAHAALGDDEARVVLSATLGSWWSVLVFAGEKERQSEGADPLALLRAIHEDVRARAASALDEARSRLARLERASSGAGR